VIYGEGVVSANTQRLVILLTFFVMALIALLVLNAIGLITFDTQGNFGVIAFKASGGAAFLAGFMWLLLEIFKRIPVSSLNAIARSFGVFGE